MANRFKSIARWLFGAGEQRQWTDSGHTWFTPGDRTVVTETSALQFSAVWACETLIADSIATLPVDTFRKSGDARTPTRPPAWVEQPNPETDRIDFDTQRILSLLGWGNAYTMLVREGSSEDPMAPVIERWLIEPWRVQVRRVGRDKAFFVDGVQIPSANVQHVKGYSLPGALTGMSVIAHARQSLELGMGAEAYGARLFENGVVPSGVLNVPALPAEASKEVVERLREQFQDRYAGTGNARKPLVLTGGTTWNQVTINPADAQFLESRQFQVEEICRWFRVPLHKVQRITNNASQGGGNGLEQMALEFAQDGLLPWTVRLERADSNLLVRGQYLRYNLNAYVRADLKTRTEVLAIKRQNGVLNADEWRALEDDAPIGGTAGTTYWKPLNMGSAADFDTSFDPGPATEG